MPTDCLHRWGPSQTLLFRDKGKLGSDDQAETTYSMQTLVFRSRSTRAEGGAYSREHQAFFLHPWGWPRETEISDPPFPWEILVALGTRPWQRPNPLPPHHYHFLSFQNGRCSGWGGKWCYRLHLSLPPNPSHRPPGRLLFPRGVLAFTRSVELFLTADAT